jgi:hypothetical protein
MSESKIPKSADLSESKIPKSADMSESKVPEVNGSVTANRRVGQTSRALSMQVRGTRKLSPVMTVSVTREAVGTKAGQGSILQNSF